MARKAIRQRLVNSNPRSLRGEDMAQPHVRHVVEDFPMHCFDRPAPVRRAALALLALAGPSRAQTGKAAAASPVLHELNAAVSRLVARVSPAVVQIRVTGYGPAGDAGGAEGPLVSRQRTIGSGVIVDPAGYVLTNEH